MIFFVLSLAFTGEALWEKRTFLPNYKAFQKFFRSLYVPSQIRKKITKHKIFVQFIRSLTYDLYVYILQKHPVYIVSPIRKFQQGQHDSDIS